MHFLETYLPAVSAPIKMVQVPFDLWHWGIFGFDLRVFDLNGSAVWHVSFEVSFLTFLCLGYFLEREVSIRARIWNNPEYSQSQAKRAVVAIAVLRGGSPASYTTSNRLVC